MPGSSSVLSLAAAQKSDLYCQTNHVRGQQRQVRLSPSSNLLTMLHRSLRVCVETVLADSVEVYADSESFAMLTIQELDRQVYLSPHTLA